MIGWTKPRAFERPREPLSPGEGIGVGFGQTWDPGPGRRPDKSTAVGRGAVGWFCWAFCATQVSDRPPGIREMLYISILYVTAGAHFWLWIRP